VRDEFSHQTRLFLNRGKLLRPGLALGEY
jgi:hypothetical protein